MLATPSQRAMTSAINLYVGAGGALEQRDSADRSMACGRKKTGRDDKVASRVGLLVPDPREPYPGKASEQTEMSWIAVFLAV
jgi:hypothetical protein